MTGAAFESGLCPRRSCSQARPPYLRPAICPSRSAHAGRAFCGFRWRPVQGALCSYFGGTAELRPDRLPRRAGALRPDRAGRGALPAGHFAAGRMVKAPGHGAVLLPPGRALRGSPSGSKGMRKRCPPWKLRWPAPSGVHPDKQVAQSSLQAHRGWPAINRAVLSRWPAIVSRAYPKHTAGISAAHLRSP